jgi:uracil-DNA glycosylase
LSNTLNKIENYLMNLNDSSKETVFIEIPSKIPENTPIVSDFPVEIKPIQSVSTQSKKSEPDIFDSGDDLFIEKPKWMLSSSLDELYDTIHNCLNCQLGSTRTNFVFGSGNPNADIMFIGEAPGADEDEQGLPFVGRAGQLLTKIIESINFSREDVYIANIIKCRPPGNRQPLPGETNECQPYLMKQIELIKPSFIVLLGLTAADTFFKTKHKMAESRGKIIDFQGIKVMITYHPAALLRNPEFKRPVWEDVKLLKRLYDENKISK